MLDHEPGENDPKSPFDGVVMSEAATPLRKVLVAQEKGAVGILFVVRRAQSSRSRRTSRPSRARPGPRSRRGSALHASGLGRASPHPGGPDLDRDWLVPCSATTKGSLEDLARASEKPRRCRLFHINGIRRHLTTDVRHHVVPDRNVLAALEGSDPKLKDEWVVISCHHDHNGADGDQIFNGADDNGSGTVGLLEIAEAYALAAQDGHRPKRSILFVSFNSEERGLLGSWAFVERPPVPLDRIVAVLNMDMVGRDEEVPEGGGRRFRGSAGAIRRVEPQRGQPAGPQPQCLAHPDDRAGQRPLRPDAQEGPGQQRSNLLRRSDQWPFLQKGVPAVFFHTGPAPRLPHARRPAREDQLPEDGADRPPGPPGELGPGPATRPPAVGSQIHEHNHSLNSGSRAPATRS